MLQVLLFTFVGAGLLAKVSSGPPRLTLLHKSLGALYSFYTRHRLGKPLGSLIQ